MPSCQLGTSKCASWAAVLWLVLVASMLTIGVQTDLLGHMLDHWSAWLQATFSGLSVDACQWKLVYAILLLHGLLNFLFYSRAMGDDVAGRNSTDTLMCLALMAASQAALPVRFIFQWTALFVLARFFGGLSGWCCGVQGHVPPSSAMTAVLVHFSAFGFAVLLMLGSVVSHTWVLDAIHFRHVSTTIESLRLLAQEFIVAYFPYFAF